MEPPDLFCLSQDAEGEIISFSKASFPHIFGSISLAPYFRRGTSHSLFFFFPVEEIGLFGTGNVGFFNLRRADDTTIFKSS